MSEPLIIPQGIFHHLDLKRWNALSDEEYLVLADPITERLEAAGWKFDELPAVQHFGPADQQQAVLQWRDARNGMLFSLIPGGDFRAGYSRKLLELYGRVYRLLQAADLDEDEEETDFEPHVSLREKPVTTIMPFLMAAEPVSTQVPGVEQNLDPSRYRIWQYREGHGKSSKHISG